MLTPKDLINAANASGYKYVRSGKAGPNGGGQTVLWKAEVNQKNPAAHWKSKAFRTPLEAAQAYCDYANGQTKMLTIEDLRNPKRKSGFDRVNNAGGKQIPDKEAAGKPWNAVLKKDPSTTIFRGPRRDTPEQAAQDYCDYINGQNKPAVAPKLKTISHVVTSIVPKMSDEERELREKVKTEQQKRLATRDSSVYLIAEDTTPLKYVKIGYSFTPDRRVANLQTSNPRPLKLLGTIPGGETEEKALHAKYIADNVLYEWFTVSPGLLAEFNVVPESEEVKKEATNVTERKARRSARKTAQREGLGVRGHRARSRRS